jgi:hypothetical protein
MNSATALERLNAPPASFVVASAFQPETPPEAPGQCWFMPRRFSANAGALLIGSHQQRRRRRNRPPRQIILSRIRFAGG